MKSRVNRALHQPPRRRTALGSAEGVARDRDPLRKNRLKLHGRSLPRRRSRLAQVITGRSSTPAALSALQGVTKRRDALQWRALRQKGVGFASERVRQHSKVTLSPDDTRRPRPTTRNLQAGVHRQQRTAPARCPLRPFQPGQFLADRRVSHPGPDEIVLAEFIPFMA